MKVKNRATGRRWPWVVPLCATGALMLGGVAGAANSASYTDPTGDSGFLVPAPDITQLDVSNEDAGLITLTVDLAGSHTLTSGEDVGVALDLDQNPDTGTVYYGTEVAFAMKGSTLEFARAAGNEFSPSAPPSSLTGTIGAGTVTFTVAASDLGLAPTDGFNVAAFSDNEVFDDYAPDIRTFNYQQVAGTPPKPLGPDTRAPVDHAFAAHGKRGKRVELDYTAQDGRAVTADTLRVYRGNRVLKTIRISLGDSNPFYSYYAMWRVPRKVRGPLRFCVRSVDRAGNKSNLSCARLVIR